MDRLPKSSNLLKSLPEGLISQLVEEGVRGQAKADSVLFAAGEPGDGLYMIEAGLLKVVMESLDGEERVISLLGAGEIAGELAMIDGLPRSASVVVLRDCSYRFISKETFEKFAATHPAFYRELAKSCRSACVKQTRRWRRGRFSPARGGWRGRCSTLRDMSASLPAQAA